MEQAHKQRLVGGIVLLALGLIFVPMVLDFSGEDRTRIENAEIPAQPEQLKMEVMPLDVWSQKESPQVSRETRVVEEIAPVEEVAESKEVKKVAAVTPEPVPQKDVVQPPQPKAAVKETPKPDVKPAPVTTGGATAWVVQVASLTVESKAYGLRDTLRKADLPALVEQVNGSKGKIYRVKVGPVLKRSEAEKIKQQVKQSTKLDGLIMKHR